MNALAKHTSAAIDRITGQTQRRAAVFDIQRDEVGKDIALDEILEAFHVHWTRLLDEFQDGDELAIGKRVSHILFAVADRIREGNEKRERAKDRP